MKNIFRMIAAALASVAAILGFAFATGTAMADTTYRPTINTTGVTYNAQTGTLTVPVEANGAVEAGYTHVSVSYDSQQIADVTLAATMNTFKYLGTTNSDDFKFDLKLTDKARSEATSVKMQVFMSKVPVSSYEELKATNDYLPVTVVDETGSPVNGGDYLTYNIPAVGVDTGTQSGSQSGAQSGSQSVTATVAKTGAAVAPYALAVVVLVVAGVALYLVRRSRSNR